LVDTEQKKFNEMSFPDKSRKQAGKGGRKRKSSADYDSTQLPP